MEGYDPPAAVRAVVVSLQRSAGGVPKHPVDRAVVGADGMEGDRQANRRFHGGPDRALCLYSRDRLDALAAEGHPVRAGSLGENVTVAGLDWALVRPGVRISIGPVRVEVTAYAPPCAQIASVFRDGDFRRVGQKVNPGWSRVYVRVLEGGELTPGCAVSLDPPTEQHMNRN